MEWTRIGLIEVKVDFIKGLICALGSMPSDLTSPFQLFEVQDAPDAIRLIEIIAKYELSWYELGKATPCRSKSCCTYLINIKTEGLHFRDSRRSCEVYFWK